jgi:phosphoribosylaminoimidazole-succinocarboxamide synthase
MNTAEALFESSIPDLPLLGRGKVRDIYSVDDAHLLIVTTDRLSAYDVVMPDPVPGKGEVLTRLSLFWFRMMADIIDNQLTDLSVADIIKDKELAAQLQARSLVVKRLKPLPIEAVVRGYLIGSGWRDYEASGRVCGIELPAGLRQAEQLPQTIFTPSSKAESGHHDENIRFADVEALIGEKLAGRVRDTAIAIYERAAAYALQRGISSRFWPVDGYQVGSSPPSFDKQFVRDYLDTLDWDKTAPGPDIPADILQQTADKYQEAYERLTKPLSHS